MASSITESQVLWSGLSSVTVSAASIVWSDQIVLNSEDWNGSIQVMADNAGTPASGDVCDVYVGWSNGAVSGGGSNDFDTNVHSEFVMRLNTYSLTGGEDAAIRTMGINISGKRALRVGVVCPQAASRNFVVRARLVTHRPQ